MTEETRADVVNNELSMQPIPSTQQRWWKTPHLVKLNMILAGLLLFSSNLGYDTSLINGLLSLPQWRAFMGHPEGAWLGFIAAIQIVGAMVCLPAQAWSANKYGRKPTLLVGYFFLVLGVGLQVGARNQAMFIASRPIVGISGAWFGSAAIIVAELAYPTHRSILTSMYQCQYYIGSTLAAWTVFGCRNMASSWAWRIPALLQIGFPLVAFSIVLICPESPRWLVSKERLDEAKAIISKWHAGGDSAHPLVGFQTNEISQSIAEEQRAAGSMRWIDMVKTRGNQRRSFITISLGFFAQWNGVGIVSYYLPLILNTIGMTSVTQQTLINACLQIWNLIISASASLFVDRAGRRVLFLLSTGIMLTCYITITALSGEFAKTGINSVGTAVIPFLFLYYGGYGIAFTPLLITYPSEIWGFSMRAKGLALQVISTSVALVFNLFANPVALEAISWKYYIVYICILVLILFVVYFTYPETKGYTLEEVAVVFEEDKGGDKTNEHIERVSTEK